MKSETPTPDRRATQRRLLAELVTLLQDVLVGRAQRRDVTAFTRRAQPAGDPRSPPFPGNGNASSVFDSVWNIERWDANGDYVVRDSDLAGYVRWLLEGSPMGNTRIAWVKGTAAQLATRIGVTAVRYWLDGLGWHDTFSFASPFTGRRFDAEAATDPLSDTPCVDIYSSGVVESLALYEDLFDTLIVDARDLFEPPAIAFRRWELWRQDDNGNRFCIETFTGRAKAEARFEQFEQLGHKQMYWLDGPLEASALGATQGT